MGILFENLQSEVLSRTVKIPILSCFGDIALATGPSFEPYLDASMNVLRQAGAIEPSINDFELLDSSPIDVVRDGDLIVYVHLCGAIPPFPMKALMAVPCLARSVKQTPAPTQHKRKAHDQGGLLAHLTLLIHQFTSCRRNCRHE